MPGRSEVTMKILIMGCMTAASGVAMFSIPVLAWAVAVSCVLCAITACVLIICGFFGHDRDRRQWLVSVIKAIRRQS
jgi:hypothetical protein